MSRPSGNNADVWRWFSVPPERQRAVEPTFAANDPAPIEAAPPARQRWAAQPAPAAPSKGAGKRGKKRVALQPGDEAFLSAVDAAQNVESHPAVNGAIWLMLISIALAVAWAANTNIEQITRADGRVVPDGREQVIASLEGGILRELMAREGTRVTVGQPLARLDPTRFESQQNEGQARRLALMASIARLQAEANGRPLVFPPDVLTEKAVVANETEAYQARRRLLEEAVGANQQSIGLVRRELDVAAGMAARGLMSEVEVVRLRRQINDMQQQMLERRNRFRQDASTELLKTQTELTQLNEQMVAREDAVRRTVLESPVDGLVKNVRMNTLGGVVNAGAPIMEIVPISEELLIEARVKPADIGFVHVGQAAEIKLSAYEYNLYGGLTGVVESISPDALGDTERQGNGPDNTWFKALIRVKQNHLKSHDQVLSVLPGMTGTVEINTGERTVLDFVLRPLLKAREAFRER
ncbi:MAG: secretion protein HlyD [Burkholderiales bacterium PBB6]|nr:MAG: secretion protein HlyD [Burkholderiales bacterium PBB6]